MEKNIMSSLISAIENIVASKLKQINYIKHIKCIYKSSEDNNYVCVVSHNDNEIKVINPNKIVCEQGDVVDVLISNTDPLYKILNFKYKKG